MARVTRVDCSGPGIRRRRRGKGFEYIDESGVRVGAPEVLARIRELAIPPAWREVWICPYPMGHIQAVGIDAAGRKQYIYHETWRAKKDREKFDHMLEFARVLPRLRRVCAEHLALSGYPKQRILACAVRLLDRGFFRMGTEGYAEQNQTYGLATIHKSHVRLHDGTIVFDYTSKSGLRRIQSIVDPEVYDLVVTLKRRRGGGPELLAYKDGRTWVDVKSTDINLYLREVTNQDLTAKDFRTWSATVLCAVALAVSGYAGPQTGRKRAKARAVKEVAHYLGNTPAVCRASYIDPRLFDRYDSGWVISLKGIASVEEFGEPSTQGAVEEAVLDLLQDRQGGGAVEKIA